MSRRHHKKSKNGCLECKGRHMRCDETRPICANCSSAEIRCSFLSKNSLYLVSGITGERLDEAFLNATPNIASTSTSVPGFEGSTKPQEQLKAQKDLYRVDMIHMKLFNNLFSDEFLSLERSGMSDAIPISLLIRRALKTQYLMHQLLAASALQLSVTTMDCRRLYREYAIGLQTRALSLFSLSNPILDVTQENCVDMFLFSSAVGVHLVCDALQHHRKSLRGFINQFTHSLGIYRGVLAVLGQSRELLRDTELGPSLEITRNLLHSNYASKQECNALLDMIDVTVETAHDKNVYIESIACLQQVFDAQGAVSRSEPQIPQAVLVWPILLPLDFVGLLNQQQPESLIILAYYAVLLDRGRDLWLIGDGGQFLVESICTSLDAGWMKWLEYPQSALQRRPGA